MKKNTFSFIYSLRVRYSEVDPQGIVFNAHYLTYFDCAITEYYRKIGYNYLGEVKKNKKPEQIIGATVVGNPAATVITSSPWLIFLLSNL